jgi:hypothetical protein
MLQRMSDATLWPRLFGNCHTHRETEHVIGVAGFEPQNARRGWRFPVWAPLPESEFVLGRARRPYPHTGFHLNIAVDESAGACARPTAERSGR